MDRREQITKLEHRFPWYAHPSSISRKLLLSCDSCRYSLRGLPRIGRCPECGEDYDKSQCHLPPRRAWTVQAVLVWVGWPLWMGLACLGSGWMLDWLRLAQGWLAWVLMALGCLACLLLAPLNFLAQALLIHPRAAGFRGTYRDGLRALSAGAVLLWVMLGVGELAFPLMLVAAAVSR